MQQHRIFNVWVIGFNTEKKPHFSDTEVRIALGYGFKYRRNFQILDALVPGLRIEQNWSIVQILFVP